MTWKPTNVANRKTNAMDHKSRTGKNGPPYRSVAGVYCSSVSRASTVELTGKCEGGVSGKARVDARGIARRTTLLRRALPRSWQREIAPRPHQLPEVPTVGNGRTS